MGFQNYKINWQGFEENHFGIENGPILLALINNKGNNTDFDLKASPEKIQKLLKLVTGKPLHFSIEGNNEYEYVPYFEVQDEAFSCFPDFAGLK